MKFHIENEVQMSATELWQTLHTPEFDAFVAREYGLKAYIEIEKQTSNHMMHRRVRIITKVDLNYTAQRIANRILGGDELVYEEIQEKYFDRFEMHWRIEPPVFKDKFQMSGLLMLKPIDDNRCLRIREGIIDVGLFGLNGLLEMFYTLQSRRVKDRFAMVVEKWKSQNQISQMSQISQMEKENREFV